MKPGNRKQKNRPVRQRVSAQAATSGALLAAGAAQLNAAKRLDKQGEQLIVAAHAVSKGATPAEQRRLELATRTTVDRAWYSKLFWR